MAEADSDPLKFAKIFVKGMLETSLNSNFASQLCKDMTVISASDTPNTRVVSRLTVTHLMCNPAGTLHGGAICTLVDVCTTVALATARKWDNPGVTRTLSTTCLVPAFPGEEIEVAAEVLQIGKRMAHTVAKMTLVKDGRLLATGVHDKAVVDPQAVMSRRTMKL